MGTEATSEAPQGAVQEPVTTDVTQASAAQPAEVQEQTPSGTPAETSAPSIDIEAALSHPEVRERMRREIQSQKDREIARERERIRQEMEAQRRRELEEAQLAQMDDEELGAYWRQQREREALIQQAVHQRELLWEQQRLQNIQTMTNAALAIVKDAKAREALAQRNAAGEFQTYEDFVLAAHEAQAAVVAEKAAAKAAKEAREATQKNEAARLAETAFPDLDAGRPAGTNVKLKGSHAYFRQALAQEAAKRK